MPEQSAPWFVSLAFGLTLIIFKSIEQFSRQVDDDSVPALIRRIYASELAERRAFLVAALMYTMLTVTAFIGLVVLIPFLSPDQQKVLGIDKAVGEAVLPLYVALGIVSLAKLGEWAGVEMGIRKMLHRFASIPQGVMETSELLRDSRYLFDRAAWRIGAKFYPAVRDDRDWEAVLNAAEARQNPTLAWLTVGSIVNSDRPLRPRWNEGDRSLDGSEDRRARLAEVRGDFVVLKDKFFHLLQGAGQPGDDGQVRQKFDEILSDNAQAINDLQTKLYLYLATLVVRKPGRYTMSDSAKALSFIPPPRTRRSFGYDHLTAASVGAWFVSCFALVIMLGFQSTGPLPDKTLATSPECIAAAACFTHQSVGWPTTRIPDFTRQMLISNILWLFTFFLPFSLLLAKLLARRGQPISSARPSEYLKLLMQGYLVGAALVFLAVLSDRAFASLEGRSTFHLVTLGHDFLRNSHVLRPLPFLFAGLLAAALLDVQASPRRRLWLGAASTCVCATVAAAVDFIFFSPGTFDADGRCTTACPQWGGFVAYSIRDLVYLSTFFAIVVWLAERRRAVEPMASAIAQGEPAAA